MLVKEYRISLPMSVEEYRIAQLYMIQRKSREESHGAGSGVEILENQPYKDGPGGDGQYTYKIYHIGSHLPGWFRAILPKSALRVEEEAWNAYPYTKTRYRCPFVEKFVLEIETKYLNDGGDKDNIFSLGRSELKDRVVDYLDIVKDPIASNDYHKEEDPKIFQSSKTKRGPLNDNWRQEYSEACKNDKHSDKAIMTAYKLCRVEFKYWGMQNKIERFIHDIGLRKTMLRAHRQAWCWQDEYYGLQLADIRRLERETQLALQETMANANENDNTTGEMNAANTQNKGRSSPPMAASKSSESVSALEKKEGQKHLMPSQSRRSSSKSRNNQLSSAMSKSSIDSSQLSDWRFQSLEQLQESSSDEDEFYDAQGLRDSVFYSSDLELSEDSDSDSNCACSSSIQRSSSMETISVSNDEFADARSQLSIDPEAQGGRRLEKLCQKYSLDMGNMEKQRPVSHLCKVQTLVLVIHGGSVLDSSLDHFNTSKRSDYSTLKSTFDTVVKANYPAAKNQVALRLVPCPHIGTEALNILSSLSPFGFDAKTPNSSESNLPWSQEFVPLGALSLFSVCSPEYQDHVNTLIAKANLVYMDFLQSDEGKGFTGQVCLLADATGSVLAYDALSRCRLSHSRAGSQTGSRSSDINEDAEKIHGSTHTLCQNEAGAEGEKESDYKSEKAAAAKSDKIIDSKTHIDSKDSMQDVAKEQTESAKENPECVLRHPCGRQNTVKVSVTSDGCDNSRRTSSGSQYESLKFDFEVMDFFMLGSPLGLVLAYRKVYTGDSRSVPTGRPDCQQMYNLFHASDPSAFRVEPFINYLFKQIPPIKVGRYNKFPMGDGESIQIVSSKWWGNKRVDYVLYCPEILHTFPVRALPPLFHASFWESTDVVAFILRQVLHYGLPFGSMSMTEADLCNETMLGKDEGHDDHPKEKWLKRRTWYKVKNLQPNHRGNDVLVLEDKQQVLSAKFMYGPLDMTSLSGEKTDVHVMSPSGEWTYMGTEVTDSHGRLRFTIPKDKQLAHGIYPVKMVVRVDHTSTDLFLAVLPPKTETVIFSIDGSFTASVSIMGKDPKVKPGAVDVVRHWQELGYLILYVTARPDMQHNKVVAWLAQHNFPHGMLAFMDGFSKEPIQQKFNYLKHVQAEANVHFRAGYGSSKDINGYKDLGLKPEQIFIVGKANKKQQGHATFVTSGYAAHLDILMTPGVSRPASGNGVFLMRKSCFSLPSGESKRSKHRTSMNLSVHGVQPEISGFVRQESITPQTLITVGDHGNTVVTPAQASFGSAVRARGTSPRPKLTKFDPPR